MALPAEVTSALLEDPATGEGGAHADLSGGAPRSASPPHASLPPHALPHALPPPPNRPERPPPPDKSVSLRGLCAAAPPRSQAPLFRSVGKMFLRSERAEVSEFLASQTDAEEKKKADLEARQT